MSGVTPTSRTPGNLGRLRQILLNAEHLSLHHVGGKRANREDSRGEEKRRDDRQREQTRRACHHEEARHLSPFPRLKILKKENQKMAQAEGGSRLFALANPELGKP